MWDSTSRTVNAISTANDDDDDDDNCTDYNTADTTMPALEFPKHRLVTPILKDNNVTQ